MSSEKIDKKFDEVDWINVSYEDAIELGSRLKDHDQSLLEYEMSLEKHKIKALASIESLALLVISYMISLITEWHMFFVALIVFVIVIALHMLKSYVYIKAWNYIKENDETTVTDFIEVVKQKQTR